MLVKKTLKLAGVAAILATTVFGGQAIDTRNDGYYNLRNKNNQSRRMLIDGDSDTDRLTKRQRKDFPVQLKTPDNITEETQYDYRTGEYTTRQKVGNLDNGNPQAIDAKDYDSIQKNKEIRGYWIEQMKQQSAIKDDKSQTGLDRYLNPHIDIDIKGFDRIFGTNSIDIHPQGNVEIIAGASIYKIDNFTLPKKQRNDVSFDFDMNLQAGVTGMIGDKMKVGINYNTEATFEFENEERVEYIGHDDEIIQRIEFGNVSMPLDGQLIQGSQTLFGAKTDLKFGKLTATAVISQQKGETKTMEINGGAVATDFEIKASDYEANRHFFLNHYFKDNYESALSTLPLVTSGITITNIEVWVTNDNLATDNTRNVVAFLDLGEGKSNIYNTSTIYETGSQAMPSNQKNNLYSLLNGTYKAVRDINSVTSTLSGKFVTGTDYEKIGNARKLNQTEYTLNAQLGFISLTSALRDDQSLAVAYEYNYRGKTYKVGEMSADVASTQAMILKLIKGTSFSPALPNWGLMMKNVYSLNAYQISSEDFELQIKYQNDKTGTPVNYINAGNIDGQMLIKVFNLDNANTQLETSPDGRFDFIEGVTINSDKGRIFLPQLEPFGSYLKNKLNDEAAASKYCFPQLYDSTKTIAKQNAERDKFVLTGSFKSTSGSEISLDAMNIPEGSVKVTCAGVELKEGTDYVVDYLLGTVKIINASVLSSGNKILVSVESNTTFSSTTKTMMGAHLNYAFSNNFNIGGTVMRLSEKTVTNKVSVGYEPIKNTIWGLDARYSTPLPFLTTLIDKLPFISTKAESRLSLEGEFAQLIPGHSKSIDKNGTCYIDDFETAQTSIDVKSVTSWVLASTPAGTKRFPEASLNNNLAYGYNRSLLAWYNILSDLQGTSISYSGSTPSHITKDDQSNHYVRAVYEREIFPNAQSISGISTQLTILNLAYYPQERGPYNYDVQPNQYSAGINSNGLLNNPQSRWAGIMREMTTTDFEASNIEYIEFWMLDPFIYQRDSMGADLYFNLGNVSEDILKDSRKSFENGLPYPADNSFIDTTAWGVVSNKTFLVNAFDNTNGAKEAQDLGFDGLSDDDERIFFSNYLQDIASAFGTNSQAYQNAYNDPSGDNYHFFRGDDYDQERLSILDRYKRYNGIEGNSCDVSENSSYSTIKDRYPDVEDINLDNTLSETESYYQYKVHLSPDEMEVGKNYITDIMESNVKTVNGQTDNVKWYQFKIPIYEPDSVVGQISDFKSIRFMRMYLTNAMKDIVLRFAELNLVRGDWRKYNYALTSAGEIVTDTQLDQGVLNLSTVSLEENGTKTPVNYLLPPGIERERDYQTNQIVEQDEKAMAMQIQNLPDGQAVAAYKTAVLDLRQYKKLKMFVHAEKPTGQILNDGDINIFVRLGSDYKENYYEYEKPLSITPEGYYADNDAGRLSVWPTENNVEIVFEDLQLVKQQRNNASREYGSNVSTATPFSQTDENGIKITIMGNPNIANIKTIMIGVRNPAQGNSVFGNDDGLSKTAEIWINELRLTDFDEDGGWAARGKATLQMADFAEVSLAGYTHTPGFGSIEKKVSERYQETVYQYDLTSQIQLGKFFNQDYGVRMPLYFGFSENYEIPKYNPLDPDIELKTTLNNPELTKKEKDEIREQSITYEKRKSINITNLHIDGRTAEAKQQAKELKNQNPVEKPSTPKPQQKQKQKPFYHVSNFTANMAYSEYFMHDITVKSQLEKILQTSLEYNYTYSPKNYKPLSKVKFLQNKNFALIKDFNFYLLPTAVAVSAGIDRQYSTIQYRNISGDGVYLSPTYQKDFIWNRTYMLNYKLSSGLTMNFSANNYSRVNPDGLLDRYAEENAREKDTLFMRFLDLGYNTNYQQTVNLKWNTPLNKIPGFRWTNLNATYNADYQWDRGLDPIQVAATDNTPEYYINHGNTISNSGILTLNGQLNFESVYRKVPYLNTVLKRFNKNGRKKATNKTEEVTYNKSGIRLTKNTPRIIYHGLGTSKSIYVTATDALGNEVKGTYQTIDNNKVKFTADEDVVNATIEVKGQKELNDKPLLVISDYFLMGLMSIRSFSITYKNQRANTTTGYDCGTKLLGMQTNNNILAPGFAYIMALNKDNFHQQAAENSWLVADSTLTDPILYTKGNSFNARVAVEPINTFKIDVTFDRSIVYNTENYFAFTSDGDWQTTQIIKSGNYRISYNMLKTAFRKLDNDYSLKTYSDFLDNRLTIANRLAQQRDGKNGYHALQNENGYPDGYNEISQEVLLQSFLAAYAGRNATKMSTNPFLKFPLPNWRIQYKGLSNIPALKDIVRSAFLTHTYSSYYTIGTFKNNADYNFDEQKQYGMSFTRYENENTFIPEYEIGTAVLEEKFAPLIGIDISWVNMLSTKLEYRRSRQITLGFANRQITELYRKEYIIGLGYKFAKLPFNIRTSSGSKNTSSDLDLRTDFVIDDDKTILREIEELYNQISAGQKSYSLRTTADYQLTQRFKLKVYYNHQINTPLISTSYRTSNIKFGFSITMSLD